MGALKNYTGAGAGLPTKLNSKGDVDVPMEARVRFCIPSLPLYIPSILVSSSLIANENVQHA